MNAYSQPPRPYWSNGMDTYRVVQSFWEHSEANRQFIRKRATHINGLSEWPRDNAFLIVVVCDDNPNACVAFEDPTKVPGKTYIPLAEAA